MNTRARRCLAALVCAVGVLAAGGRAAAQIPDDAAQRIREAVPRQAPAEPAEARKLLVFTLCKGFFHGSIPYGAEAVRVMGEESGAYEAVISDDPSMFEPDNLSQFDAVCMLNTTGPLFEDDALKASLLDFVRGGGGLIGIHAATDCFYDWAEYGELIGGYFIGHPWNEDVGIVVEEPDHPVCGPFQGGTFRIVDEIYEFREPYSRGDLRVLLSMDTDGTPMLKDNIGRSDGDFAVSWVRGYGDGRVFYCSLGHREEIFWNPTVLAHYLAGIQFAMGDLDGETEPVQAFTGGVLGDWQGEVVSADGQKGKLVAQVIPLGDGKYRANVMNEFDTRDEPVAVLEGERRGRRVEFTGAVIEGDEFTGMVEGEGAFAMRQVERPSPTLGAEPPDGAVVLFDGDDMDRWNHAGSQARAVELDRLVGGDNRAAYLRTTLHSPVEQTGRLELGSDDGIKVWLNGDVIHVNNVFRGLRPGDDVLDVNLREGANELMLKITQGGGGWSACARVAGADGVTARLGEAESVLADHDGFVALWEVSGPHTQEGVDAGDLLDIEFAPETGEADWQAVPELTASGSRWRLTRDGAAEIVPGTGSAISKDVFGDFRLHMEFRLPLMAGARGQGRANSGVYLQGRYEVQILDSYGLEGRDNECGGIYQVGAPRVNMCAPPRQWQTYDMVFSAPRFDADGTKTANAVVTVAHNGVVIHENLEVLGLTGGNMGGDPAAPGPLMLQDHGNRVQFRNIWALPLTDSPEGADG